MEITTDIKAKVFAQYLGQPFTMNAPNRNVIDGSDFTPHDLKRLYDYGVDGMGHEFVLHLRPLSEITDEDVRDCVRIHLNIPSDKPCPLIINGSKKDGYRQAVFNTQKSIDEKYDTVDMYIWFDTENSRVDYNWSYNNKHGHGITNERFAAVNQIYQYLQSKGYDLPQYLLGGKTLNESGLAVYKQSA